MAAPALTSYDRVLESVKVADREKKSAQGLRNDPPKILFAREPTVLVTLDGRFGSTLVRFAPDQRQFLTDLDVRVDHAQRQRGALVEALTT